MKKVLLALAIMGALAGCSDTARPLYFSAMPEDFKDCKIAVVTNSDGYKITLARCPNSTTSASVPQGKTVVTTITVDGVEYVSKEK